MKEQMTNNKKRTIGVTIFGLIFIILGLLALPGLIQAYAKSKNVLPRLIGFLPGWKYLLRSITSFGIFSGLISSLIYVTCGIGILRLKFWARYIAITLILTSIMNPVDKALIFGSQSINIMALLFQVAFISFVLWFFMRRKIKKQFEVEVVQFKLKSISGAVIYTIIFLSFLTSAFIFGVKIYSTLRLKESFFAAIPQVIKLQKMKGLPLPLLEKYRRRELLNTSVLIPNDLVTLSFNKLSNKPLKWIVFMANPAEAKKGCIVLESGSMYKMMSALYKAKGFKDTYDFEREILTNNWSPIFISLRIATRTTGEVFKIEQINSSTFKGFMKSTYNKEDKGWVYDTSFYSKEDRSSRDMQIVYNEGYLNRTDVLNIISSVILLEEMEAEADRYYEKGLEFLNASDFVEAQFKFANAYYLSPENPEYGYMLAKMLFKNGKRSFNGAKKILENVLKLDPGHKEAKELLETILSHQKAEKQLKKDANF